MTTSALNVAWPMVDFAQPFGKWASAGPREVKGLWVRAKETMS